MNTPPPLHLRRVDPDCNMARFYRLEITASLFGDHALLRHWGRIGQKGRQIIELHRDPGSAARAFSRYARQKQLRGYIRVSREGAFCAPSRIE